MKVKTINLSGFGGSYENACQLMVSEGIKAMQELGIPDPKEFGEFGFGESERAKQIQSRMCKAVNNDATGAQMGVSLSLAFYISKNGRDKLIEKMQAEAPDRIFEWDGTVESCPAVLPELADLEKERQQ